MSSGDYEAFMVQLLTVPRQEGVGPDPALAAQQAGQLCEAAKGWGTNESVFIQILGQASIEQVLYK